MIKINLVSEGRRPVVSRKTKERLGIAGLALGEGLFMAIALVAALVTGVYWWYLRGEVQERARRIDVAEKEVKRLEKVLQEVEEYKAKKASLEHKIAVIDELKRNQRGPVQLMDQISKALQAAELTWLETMQVHGNNVELRGKSFNYNQIAAFIESLGKQQGFNEPRLGDSTKQGSVLSFVITFNFSIARPTPTPSETAPAAATPAAATP